MKKIFYLLLLLSINIFAQNARTLGPTTRVIGVDTITSGRALTTDANGNIKYTLLQQGSGSTDFERYDRLTDFPNPGNPDVLYYADLENFFYKWQVGTQNYSQIPGNDFSITAQLRNSVDFRELVNNNTVKDRFFIHTENFITVSDITLKGYDNIDLNSFDYEAYDIHTGQIQQGVTNVDYILIRKSKFPFLEEPGKTYQGPYIGNEVSPNLTTVYRGRFNVTTNNIDLPGLNPDFYCFINNGTRYLASSTGSTVGIRQLMLNLIDFVPSGSGSETTTTLVDNGGSFTYTNEVGTQTTVAIPTAGSSSSNPNHFTPTQTSDFTTPTEANKVWIIQEDFDLGSSNFDVPGNVILHFRGGSITTTGTIDLDKTLIVSDDPYSQIFNIGGFTGTLKGNFVLNWLGPVGDGGITDNRVQFKQAEIVNTSGGDLFFYNDSDQSYGMSVVQNTTANADVPSNIVISGNGTSWIGIPNEHGRPKIKMIGHGLTGSELFATYDLYNGSISGFHLIGEREEHINSGGPDERNHLIVVGHNTTDVKIYDNYLEKSEADGIYFINDVQRYNQHTTLEYTQGSLDRNNNVVADNNYMISDNFYPVTNADFTERGKFIVVGDSFGTTFEPREFIAVYYSGTDPTNDFIGRSETLKWFDENKIPPGTTHIRLILPYTTENLQVTLGCSFVANGTEIHNNTFDQNFRQSISNPGQHTKIYANHFLNVGDKSPARHIDIEDGFQLLRYIYIYNNTFQDGHNGDIITKSGEFLFVYDNTFKPNTEFNWTYLTNGTGLQMSTAFHSIFRGNTFYQRQVSIGKGSIFPDNIMHGGEIRIYNDESKVTGLEAYNTNIRWSNTTHIDGNFYVENSTFEFDKPIEDYIISQKGSLVLNDVVYDFNNTTDYTGAQKLVSLFNLVTDGSEPVNGYIDNLTIKNIEVNDANKHDQGFEWYAQNISNLHSSLPLDIRQNGERDLYFRNINVKGRFRLRLDQFTNDNTDHKNVRIKDLNIDVDHPNYVAFTAYPLKTENKDINLIIDGGEIKGVTGVNRVLNFLHTGTTDITDVDFIFADPVTIDLNTLATGDKVTFKDCYFSPNVTLVLRPGDENLQFGAGGGADGTGGWTETSTQTSTDKELVSVNNGKLLIDGVNENAIVYKRTGTIGTGNHIDPVFETGRIVGTGIGEPTWRILYSDSGSDTNEYSSGESLLFAVEPSGTTASVRRKVGSHFEGFIDGETEPFFRLESIDLDPGVGVTPSVRFRMGPGGTTANDIELIRRGDNQLSLALGGSNKWTTFADGFQLESGVTLNFIDTPSTPPTPSVGVIKLYNQNGVLNYLDNTGLPQFLLSSNSGPQLVSLLNTETGGTEWQGSSAQPLTTITEYSTRADLLAQTVTGNEFDTYAYVSTDTNDDYIGLYAIVDGAWKIIYHYTNPNIPIKRGINEIDLNSPDIELDQAFVGNGNGQQSNVNTFITNYIPVRKGDRLGKVNFSAFRLYDENKVAIDIADAAYGGSNFNDDINITQDYVEFARWTINDTDSGVTDMIVKEQNKIGGAEPIGWASYGGYERDNDNYIYEANGVIWKKLSNNLFDIRNADFTGGYNSGGTFSNSNASTGFIEVEPNTVYSHNFGSNLNISFWDAEGNYISGLVSTQFVTPANCRFVNIQVPRSITSWNDLEVQQNVKVNDLVYSDSGSDIIKEDFQRNVKVCLIGDSIGTEDDIYATNVSYGSLARNILQIRYFANLSVSGKSMRNFAQDINGGAFDLPTDYDLYVIALGTNDYGFNRPLGTLGVGTSPDDFYGSMANITSTITAANPNAKFAFITPFKRGGGNTDNVVGLKLSDYVDAIKRFCLSNGIPYADAFNDSGFDPNDPQINVEYCVSQDELHLNDPAHKIYGFPLMATFLKQLINNL